MKTTNQESKIFEKNRIFSEFSYQYSMHFNSYLYDIYHTYTYVVYKLYILI